MKAIISHHTHTDTRELILSTALDLLLTRSYVGLSFQELAERVGIRKPSIYHHFASKELLGIALMASSQARFTKFAEDIAWQTPREQLLSYVKMFRNSIGAGSRVCPVGATGGEWDCLEPALKDAVRAFHQAQLQWLTTVSLRLNAHPPGKASKEARMYASQWAAQVNAVCQGAMINARMYGSPEVFDIALAPLVAQLQIQH